MAATATAAGERAALGPDVAARLDRHVERARAAFADASLRTNPRIPLMRELIQLLEEGFNGR